MTSARLSEPAAPRPAQDFNMGPESAILTALAYDGRASYETLATRVGTSRQTIWRRVRGLVGSVVWGFTAVLDHQRIGWRQYLISLQGAPDYETVQRVEDAELAVLGTGNVRVLQSMLVRGVGWRFVVHVAAANSLAMETFMQALRDRFPGKHADWQLDEIEYVVRDAGFRNPRRDVLHGLPARGGAR